MRHPIDAAIIALVQPIDVMLEALTARLVIVDDVDATRYDLENPYRGRVVHA
jgi:hypothetical protein